MKHYVLSPSSWGLRWVALLWIAAFWITGCQGESSPPTPIFREHGTGLLEESPEKSAPENVVPPPALRSGNLSLVTEPHHGPPEMLTLWSSFMMHPEQRILPGLAKEWFGVKCEKVKLSAADEGMGLPITVGWDVRLEEAASGKIQIYVDSLGLAEAPELASGKPLSPESLQALLDRPVPEQPAMTLTGDHYCLYFYVQEAAYRFYVRGIDAQGNESSVAGPIVASIFQMLRVEDLTSAITQDMSISSSEPEIPDQLKLAWVPVQIGLPELHDAQNPNYLLTVTSEYYKILRGLEHLIHLYVDDKGVGQTVSVPHYVTETEVVYKDVVPFDYFSLIRGKTDGSPSGRHKLMTYRYNDACDFSVENAKVEACRRSDYIVLYPQYMKHDDDFRRGVILMHESSHKGKQEGGVGPHSCGRGADVGPGSYTAGISVLRRVIERSKNCFERASAYTQMVTICSLNVVGSKEFYQRHCHTGVCDSDWANLLKDLGCTEMDRMVNPNGECFPGRNEIVSPSVCEI